MTTFFAFFAGSCTCSVRPKYQTHDTAKAIAAAHANSTNFFTDNPCFPGPPARPSFIPTGAIPRRLHSAMHSVRLADSMTVVEIAPSAPLYLTSKSMVTSYCNCFNSTNHEVRPNILRRRRRWHATTTDDGTR